jgi:hypothetical protein
MIVYLFRSSSAPKYCVTNDRSGGNIPVERQEERWAYVKDLQLQPGEQRLAVDSDDALEDIRVRGYHLVGGWYTRA